MALPAYRVAQSVTGSAPFVKEFTTTASTGSAVAGQFVTMAADGTVSVTAEDGDNVTGLATQTVGAGATVLVILATPDLIFSCTIGYGTYSDAACGAHWDYNPTGIDLGSSTDDIFLLHGQDETDTGRVLVSVNSANTVGVPANPTAV